MVHPAPGTGLRQLLDTRKVTQVADMTTIQPYIERDPFVVRSVELGGYRSVVNVPMLKENKLVGAISIYHQEVRPFTERQIELVSNFANQAIIAIENARLLNELRQRTEQVEAQASELAQLNQQLEQRVTDQVGEIERMGRLRRFLPPQVADLIVTSGTEKQLESHRREITALFCDLRGFTGFTESADLPAGRPARAARAWPAGAFPVRRSCGHGPLTLSHGRPRQGGSLRILWRRGYPLHS